jgi:hypothetical protein
MAPANEVSMVNVPARLSTDPHLDALLHRLATVSLEPGFRIQREIALARVLRPYLETAHQIGVEPLPEELELAQQYLYADFFPEDGQLDLIEQVRDMIEVHVSVEERAWLDPLHHSYLELLEILPIPHGETDGALRLRSLGDGHEDRLPAGEAAGRMSPGQVVLTRLVRQAERISSTGAAIILSAGHARAILGSVEEWRRDLEASSGSFALGEWGEFSKRYGYTLLWQVAQARLGLLIAKEAQTRFLTPGGEPFLYALALYEHHDPRLLTEGLNAFSEFGVEPVSGPAAKPEVRRWIQQEPLGTVARMTLTPAQLLIECDSPERLEGIKHRLAATFGFTLHFKVETGAKPRHAVAWRDLDLAQEAPPAPTVTVAPDEEQRLLGIFLESAYLEWAEQPCPALGGQTPRHVAASPEGRIKVAALIDEMARVDLGKRRTGAPAFDYNQLRSRVDLA